MYIHIEMLLDALESLHLPTVKITWELLLEAAPS
jgi:hypothetical protein